MKGRSTKKITDNRAMGIRFQCVLKSRRNVNDAQKVVRYKLMDTLRELAIYAYLDRF